MQVVQRALLSVIVLVGFLSVNQAAELAGSEWRPTRLMSASIPAEANLFVQFKGEGRLAGHGGCNRFFGSYHVADCEIEISGIGSTRMACPEAIMQRETVFFEALGKARTFKRDRLVLVLFDEAQEEIAQLAQTDTD